MYLCIYLNTIKAVNSVTRGNVNHYTLMTCRDKHCLQGKNLIGFSLNLTSRVSILWNKTVKKKLKRRLHAGYRAYHRCCISISLIYVLRQQTRSVDSHHLALSQDANWLIKGHNYRRAGLVESPGGDWMKHLVNSTLGSCLVQPDRRENEWQVKDFICCKPEDWPSRALHWISGVFQWCHQCRHCAGDGCWYETMQRYNRDFTSGKNM